MAIAGVNPARFALNTRSTASESRLRLMNTTGGPPRLYRLM